MSEHYLSPEDRNDHLGGSTVPTKRRAYTAKPGQRAYVDVELQDRQGNPVNIEDFGVYDAGSSLSSLSSGELAPSVVAKFHEAMGADVSDTGVTTVDAEVTDASGGSVRILLPKAVRTPGLWICEVGVLDSLENMLFSNTVWVVVDRGLFGGDALTGPPTIAEIRLFLRDFAQENELLDVVDFDASEIALAIQMPIQEWNETPPNIKTYTTATFPFRYHWMLAICSRLFTIAAEHYRRNRFTYQAGGVNADDKNRQPAYDQKAVDLRQQWQHFIKTKKVEMNLDACWGEVGSTYGSTYGI